MTDLTPGPQWLMLGMSLKGNDRMPDPSARPSNDPLTRLRRGLGSGTESAPRDSASAVGGNADNVLQRLLSALGSGPGARGMQLGETLLDAPTGLANLVGSGISKLPLIGGDDDALREQSAAAGAGQVASAMQRLLMTVEDLRRAQPGGTSSAPAPRKRELAR